MKTAKVGDIIRIEHYLAAAEVGEEVEVIRVDEAFAYYKQDGFDDEFLASHSSYSIVDKSHIENIIKLLEEEIEFAKGCGMPQFVMGIMQAKKVIEGYKKENEL